MPERIRAVALAGYPLEAAATRFRLTQLAGPLRERGIDLEVLPFLDARSFESLYDRRRWLRTSLALAGAIGRRVAHLKRLRGADVIIVQREAALIGPPLFERVACRGRAMLLDLDDATWVSYDSPTYGRLARILKWPGKADALIDMATVVTCGSPAIAEYVTQRGRRGLVVPTVVDTEVFRPRGSEALDLPVVGWIGSHSTFPYLESIGRAISAAGRRAAFRLLVVGSGRASFDVPGVEVECREWSLDREVADFQEIDVGLYPLAAGAWAHGKSGFKAIEYLAVGVAYIASPVGAAGEAGVANITHLEARTDSEWEDAIVRLVNDRPLRSRMGTAGRVHALEVHGLAAVAEAMAAAIRDACH